MLSVRGFKVANDTILVVNPIKKISKYFGTKINNQILRNLKRTIKITKRAGYTFL